MKTTIAKYLFENNVYKDRGIVRIPTVYYDQIMGTLKEQEKEIERLKLELKEQEPRILNWDEIRNYPVVYGEFKDVKEIYPLIITINSFDECLSWNPGINVSGEFLLLVSDEEDRKNTRCWNKIPTDEQRQAVKWNEVD